jgi:hypothetical protein
MHIAIVAKAAKISQGLKQKAQSRKLGRALL